MKIIRLVLRIVAFLIALFLVLWGSWTSIELLFGHGISRAAPLFDRLAVWLMPVAAFLAAYFLVRFVDRKPGSRQKL
jgi:hypothetical protein